MRKVLGLDLGTNSIGWALVETDFENKKGAILGAGSRIIPMAKDVLGKFDSGVSISQTAERTGYRGTRRLYQRDNLRRERLHRVLNVLDFLPAHYAEGIDFEKRFGQFKPDVEVKINYRKVGGTGDKDVHEFIFEESFEEMVADFESRGMDTRVPKDWTIYYLRQKALSQKVSKEELAWILLNFNQKRGYYQTRGEDVDGDKSKEYIELIVDRVEDTGEEVKGKALYTVYFTNGWEYDKQVVKTENWLGRTKEFIVTTSFRKDGTIKRTYKAVDAEKDWPAIKAKTEQSIEQSELTVGQYIYKALLDKPSQKVRGSLIKTVERKFYKAELAQILEEQVKHHSELQDRDLYERGINELYRKNDAHKNNIISKGFEYLFMDDIIFYHRPLRSKKSSISGCQYESRSYIATDRKTGNKSTVNQAVKAMPKSHPLFQEFRLWQFVMNIRILKKENFVHGKTIIDDDFTQTLLPDQDSIVGLFDYLNGRKEVEGKNVLDYFVKKGVIQKVDKDKYKWNYMEDKKYPCNETRSQIISKLKKVEGIEAENFLGKEKELKLWHIIYSVTDKKEFETALGRFATENSIDETSFVSSFLKMPPYASDYGSYSFKAITKLLPLMRMGTYWDSKMIPDATSSRIEKLLTGEYDTKIRNRVREKAINLTKIEDFQGLPLWLAAYIVYDRHSEGRDVAYWTNSGNIDSYLSGFKQHSLRNPIVEKVVTETLRVVRDIWKYYGNSEERFFDEIHVELGRSMKNPKAKREVMSKRITENENTNQRIRELLQELMNDPDVEGDVRPHSPSHQEIMKIYEEGVRQNPGANYDRVNEDEVEKIRKNKSPSKSDITRYKLWLEQGYISPYTGQVISLSRLFTTDYEIEHIIPQSRYFDNSLSNKVICESEVNSDKGNKTAYEYLLQKGGSFVHGHSLLNIGEYETHCNRYFNKNRDKLRNLLSEDIPEGFINRQMNDSRYISKFVKGVLSNLVREEQEQEATSKHVITMPGAITSKLKQDWGLNDKWNEIIAPRFKRLNDITKSDNFGYWDNKINAFRIQVPEELKRGFSKKRIDHRHHTLDAIVIACCTRSHSHYLNSLSSEKDNFSLRSKLLSKSKNGDYTKHFLHPWPSFALDTKDALQKTIVSFKKNNRVINKTNNKTWQWVMEDGKQKKKLVRQTKGANWAIRKPLHKETVAGKINVDGIGNKLATAVRTNLSDIKSEKQIQKIADVSIQKILRGHLKNYLNEKGEPQFDQAFSGEGVDDMNNKIITLNGGKRHMPIKKVRIYEVGSKFPVGYSGNNSSKYVEAAKGTNLFFAVYQGEKGKRAYETVPLNEVIEHQKLEAAKNAGDRTLIQENINKGFLLFTLSPNDLVYVPTEEETNDSSNVDIGYLDKLQVERIYKMVSCTGGECHFIPYYSASEIRKNENGTNSKSERVQLFGHSDKLFDDNGKGIMIKSRCWKLSIDRLGNIVRVISGDIDSKGIDHGHSSIVLEPSVVYAHKKSISINQSETDKYKDIAKYVDETSFAERLKHTVDLIKRAFDYQPETPKSDRRISFK